MQRKLTGLLFILSLLLAAANPWPAAAANDLAPQGSRPGDRAAGQLAAGEQGHQAQAGDPQGSLVVRIPFSTRAQVEQLTARLDVWEVHYDLGYAVAYVSAAERAWLTAQGFTYTLDPTLNVHPDTIPGFPCYHTVTEIYAQLDSWAATYPNLTELRTIGYTWENRPLKVLRITNKAMSGSKPTFFLMANIHGRELATSETALTFVQTLLQGYSTDPDITWLLNYHEVHVLLLSNPDGHVKNEAGQPWAYWRKNTHPYGSCTPDGNGNGPGVDLNRNHTWMWNHGGSSSYQCDATYMGPAAGSEPEVQYMQQYVMSLPGMPDQRGTGDGDAAPANATGLFLTLHSYARLVLWPWGWTPAATANGAQLAMIGTKLATFNGYTPQPAYDLYPTSGTSDDWAYGELGVASFTFELAGSDFFPSCSELPGIIQPNIGALLYAFKIARTPYMTSFGPDALSLTATPVDIPRGVPAAVKARIDDTANSKKTVVAAEAYIDTPPWSGGAPTLLAPTDGAWDQQTEWAQGNVPTDGLSVGRHMVFVRGKEAGGNWGPVSALWINIKADSKITGQVTDAGSHARLAGAQIDISGTGQSYQATTNASGYYTVSVVGGTYAVGASAFGYVQQSATGIVAPPSGTVTQNFALVPLLAGRVAGSVHELGSNAPLAATVTVQGPGAHTDTDLATGAFELNLPVGSYTLVVSAAGHDDKTLAGVQVLAGQTTPLPVMLAPYACTLFVDDDYYSSGGRSNYETYYRAALEQIGIHYQYWDVRTQGDPSQAELARHKAALWFTGDAGYNTLNAANQSALSGYLAGGGGLFLTGQNIAADLNGLPGHFLRDVLHAGYLQGNGASPVTGSGIFAGQTYPIQGGDGANNQSSPDLLAALSGASPTFSYSGGSTAGVATGAPTAYRSLFLGYGVEGIATAAGRAAALRSGLDWLGCGPATVDLRLGLTAAPPAATPGALVSYQLALQNSSAIPLNSLVVTDVLPLALDFVDAAPAAALDGHTVRWSGLALPAQGSQTLTLVARVRAGTAAAVIHNADYGAQSPQMAQAAAGTSAADTTVLQVYGAGVGPGVRQGHGAPGAAVTYLLNVLNTGNGPDSYTATAGSHNWPVNIEPATIGPLGAGAMRPFTITVSVPAGVQPGAADSTDLTITSVHDAAAQAAATLHTIATYAYAVSLQTAASHKLGLSGHTVQYTLTVTNTGSSADSYSLSLAGNAWQTALDTVSLGPLGPGASATVLVTVTVPADAAPDASDTVTVTAQSHGDTSTQASVQLTTGLVQSYLYLPVTLK